MGIYSLTALGVCVNGTGQGSGDRVRIVAGYARFFLFGELRV